MYDADSVCMCVWECVYLCVRVMDEGNAFLFSMTSESQAAGFLVTLYTAYLAFVLLFLLFRET